jgi:hypothetical protein
MISIISVYPYLSSLLACLDLYIHAAPSPGLAILLLSRLALLLSISLAGPLKLTLSTGLFSHA